MSGESANAAAAVKLALFGATGRTGAAVLEAALAKGMVVNAMVRTPEKVEVEHENLTVLKGELDSEEAITKTVQGCDYCVCVAGGPLGKPAQYPPSLMENFVRLLVPVIKASPTVKAFSYQAGFLASQPDERASNSTPWSVYLLRKSVARGLEPNLRDHEKVMDYLADEGKGEHATTVVMAPMLKDGEAARTLRNEDGRMATTSALSGVSFKELAELTLNNVQDTTLDGRYLYPCA